MTRVRVKVFGKMPTWILSNSLSNIFFYIRSSDRQKYKVMGKNFLFQRLKLEKNI